MAPPVRGRGGGAARDPAHRSAALDPRVRDRDRFGRAHRGRNSDDHGDATSAGCARRGERDDRAVNRAVEWWRALGTRDHARRRAIGRGGAGDTDRRWPSGVDDGADVGDPARIASGANGHEIAAAQPDPEDIVTVLAEPPITIAFAALTTLDAEEGTPVLDSDGDLIGLCSQRHGAGDDQPITLIDVTGDITRDSTFGEQRAAATTIAP